MPDKGWVQQLLSEDEIPQEQVQESAQEQVQAEEQVQTVRESQHYCDVFKVKKEKNGKQILGEEQ